MRLNLCRYSKALSQIIHRNSQRVVCSFLGADGLYPSLLNRVIVNFFYAVPVIQHGTEEGNISLHATAALCHRQRRLLVFQQLCQCLTGCTNDFPDALSSQPQSYRQCVDEHPQHPVRTGHTAHTAREHAAKHHIIAVTAPGHHQPIGHVKQYGRAHIQSPSHPPNPGCQCIFQSKPGFLYALPIAMNIEQSEWGCRFIHIAQQLTEVIFCCSLIGMSQAVCHEIPVLYWLWQRPLLI